MSQMILQRCTAVARHLTTSIVTPYKHAYIFQTRFDFQERTMDAAVPIPPHGMVHMLNIKLQLLPPNSCTSTRTMARDHDRTFTIRPITLTHTPSTDHLITRTMMSLHRTTLAFVAQRTAPGRKTYRKI